MKKFIKLAFICLGIIITIGIVIKLVEYNSLSSKNTRSLEKILFEDIKLGKYSNEGMVKDLITIDYDKLYVFEPYESVEEMEKQLGLKHTKLKVVYSEGWMNMVFIKEDRIVAYLYGFDSYYIDLPKGIYSKEKMNQMIYYSEEKEIGNSSDARKKYIYYEFKEK
ncbi:hypothetical protein KQI41_18535 [Tissierella pigra]|uniref:Uncharacterized protein n=1 Tax=Tissierella pigra TaxID=2607614 RepID=A0A6N7XM90_9FIRM|nr:hypothetical protein [Tissierella pigra]MBU5428390.1 hypothetical protein [Tissierella pigra]MSU02646.1 hypothetical protein [Tissierella pigra]